MGVIKDTRDVLGRFTGRFTTKATQERDPSQVFRPEFDISRLGRTRGIQLPLSPVHPIDIQEISRLSVIIKTCTLNIRNQIFRRGYEWIPAYACKCKQCAKTYEVKKQACVQCGCEEFYTPNPDEYQKTENFFQTINSNGERLIDVLVQFEDDLNQLDDSYLVLLKDYILDSEGDIQYSRVKEIVRGSPIFMRMVGDRRGNLGNVYFVCLEHRDYISTDPKERCKKCGKKLHDVHYVGTEWGEKPVEYFVKGEVIHVSKYSPSLLYGWSPILNCFDEETEVLTKAGWKLFKDTTDDDVFATLNPQTKILEYQKRTNYIQRPHEGLMYQVRNTSIDLLVTPDHQMYVRPYKGAYKKGEWQFKTASDIKGKIVEYRKDAKWLGQEQSHFTLPSIPRHYRHVFASGSRWNKDQKFQDFEKEIPPLAIPMDIWLEFMGYYISEGWCNAEKGSTSVSQNAIVNGDKLKKIEGCLSQLPFNQHRAVDDNKGNVRINLYSKQLSLYLGSLGTSREKYIPEELKQLSPRQLKILFDALMLGDGSGRVYATTSKRLADDVQEIILKMGASANIAKSKQGTYLITHRGLGTRNTSRAFINMRKRVLGTDIKRYDDQYVPYKGNVYCVTVPNHTLYVRRNGKAVWCGNCYKLALALMSMENYIYEYYRFMRRPRGILAVNTKNPASLSKMWDNVSRRIAEDPHYTPLLAVENDTGRGRVEFVPLDDTLYEMQYTQVRDEFRDRISALYGVTHIFQNAQRGGVGLANEGLEVVVTNRVIEWGQSIYNEKVFPRLLEEFGIKDWRLKLKPNETKDQMAELARFDKKIDMARKIRDLGYAAELVAEGEDLDSYHFVYKKSPRLEKKPTGAGISPPVTEPPPPEAEARVEAPEKAEELRFASQPEMPGRASHGKQRMQGEPDIPDNR